MLSTMTADTTKTALLFAGSGESNFANTAELLNDYFGIDADTDRDYDGDEIEFGNVYFVLTESKPSTGLDSMFDWADWLKLDYTLVIPDGYKENRYNKAYFKYAQEIVVHEDLVSTTFARLDTDDRDGLDPLLVFAWGDEPTEEDFDLLEAATVDEFKAVDITAGLDDLILEPEAEEPEAAPEPEPKPEPEEKPKRTRGNSTTPKKTDAGTRTRTTPKRSTKTEDIPEENPRTTEDVESVPKDGTVVLKRVNKETLLAAFGNMHAVVVALVEQLPDDMNFELNVPYHIPNTAEKAVEPATEEPEEDKPAEPVKRGRGRPRNPNPKPVKEYLADDGEWVRAGRGRPPKDVEIRWVNPETGEEVDAPA